MNTNLERRQWVLGLAGLLLAGPSLAGQLLQTPAQSAGPFYPLEPPLDQDNDLTRVAGQSGTAEGRLTDLSGRVLDLDGRPIAKARVEIWQCDARGHYHHPEDDGPYLDPNFQGFGHDLTDAEGRYRFRTIHPVPYPGRTPHIHFAVFVPGERRFTTQLYVAGEPGNDEDFLFRILPLERRHLVLSAFVPSPQNPNLLATQFDIILGQGRGTPVG